MRLKGRPMQRGGLLALTLMVSIALCAVGFSLEAQPENKRVCRLVNGEQAEWKGLNLLLYYHGDRQAFSDWVRASEISSREVLSQCCIEMTTREVPSPFGRHTSAVLADKDETFPSETLIFDDGARVVVTREFWTKYEAHAPGVVSAVVVREFVKRNGDPDHSCIGFSWNTRKLVWANSYYKAPGDIFPGGNIIHEIGHSLDLPHPHSGNGKWLDPDAARDNFMTQGSWGQLPNRSVTRGQCEKLRNYATAR